MIWNDHSISFSLVKRLSVTTSEHYYYYYYYKPTTAVVSLLSYDYYPWIYAGQVFARGSGGLNACDLGCR